MLREVQGACGGSPFGPVAALASGYQGCQSLKVGAGQGVAGAAGAGACSTGEPVRRVTLESEWAENGFSVPQ